MIDKSRLVLLPLLLTGLLAAAPAHAEPPADNDAAGRETALSAATEIADGLETELGGDAGEP